MCDERFHTLPGALDAKAPGLAAAVEFFDSLIGFSTAFRLRPRRERGSHGTLGEWKAREAGNRAGVRTILRRNVRGRNNMDFMDQDLMRRLFS